MKDKNRFTVVHIVPAYPPHLGGMEQRVKELATKLVSDDCSVEVITSDMGAQSGITEEKKVKVVRLKSVMLFQTPVAFALFGYLWNVKADVFHIHVAQAFFPDVAAIVARLRKIPYVVHVRCFVDPSSPAGQVLLPIYRTLFFGPMLRNAQRVIALTPDYRAALIEKYSVKADKIIVIPNATEFSVVQNALTEINRPVRLLAVGRLSEQKNYHLMLHSVALLNKSMPGSYRLSIVGDGDQENELKLLAHKLGIDPYIVWHGRLDGLALEQIYMQSDIFIHTSRVEGFATVFVEAMSKGLPICATRALGTNSVIADRFNGLLCDSDPSDFSMHLQQLINDRELFVELSRNNLSTVKKYNWKDIIQQTNLVYSEIKSN